MKAKIMAVVAATLVSGPAALAASPTWVDWTSTTSGTMGTTAVTLAGPADWLENGTYYYDNSATTTPPANTYAGLNPFDVIGVTQTGTFTLTFSQAVGSLYMSLVSVGNGGEPVTYQFSDPFTVVSSGPNYWGIGEFDVVGNNFTGIEYNGILKLSGDFGPNHRKRRPETVLQPEGVVQRRREGVRRGGGAFTSSVNLSSLYARAMAASSRISSCARVSPSRRTSIAKLLWPSLAMATQRMG